MGLEDNLGDALDTSGAIMLGVFNGWIKMVVPIAAVGLAFGMSLRIVKMGVKIGGVE